MLSLRIQAALCRRTAGEEESVNVWYAAIAIHDDRSKKRPSDDIEVCRIVSPHALTAAGQAYNVLTRNWREA
jgi:hypothetical protein